MRTSLTEIAQAEQYLMGELSGSDQLVFEARMVADPLFGEAVSLQARVYKLLRLFHFKKVRAEIAQVMGSEEHAVFTRQMQSLFK